MEWSKKIGSVADIPIRLHLTMLILAAWLLLGAEKTSSGHMREFLEFVILFGSVCVHELGHALMAKRLGMTRPKV